jgi:hypothetical protein
MCDVDVEKARVRWCDLTVRLTSNDNTLKGELLN